MEGWVGLSTISVNNLLKVIIPENYDDVMGLSDDEDHVIILAAFV